MSRTDMSKLEYELKAVAKKDKAEYRKVFLERLENLKMMHALQEKQVAYNKRLLEMQAK